MAAQTRFLTITLEDVNRHDAIPQRILQLEEPQLSVRIGRGTQHAEQDLLPEEDNAWFESRVLSRNHAIIRANPIMKQVTIEDIGSMHGTRISGRKLAIRTPEILYSEDIIEFGAKVTRGSHEFPALELKISFQWSDDHAAPQRRPMHANKFQNSFTADYSDDDDGATNNSDIDIIHESVVRQPSVEVVLPPHATIIIPDSDKSESRHSSVISDDDIYEDESLTTSPPLEFNKQRAPRLTEHDQDYSDSPSAGIYDDFQNDDLNGAILQTSSPVPPYREHSVSDFEDSSVFDGEDVVQIEETTVSAAPVKVSNDLGDRAVGDSSKNSATPLNASPFDMPQGRAPSPSDAAMVKPSVVRPTSATSAHTDSNGTKQQPGYSVGITARSTDSSQHPWNVNQSMFYESYSTPIEAVVDGNHMLNTLNPFLDTHLSEIGSGYSFQTTSGLRRVPVQDSKQVGKSSIDDILNHTVIPSKLESTSLLKRKADKMSGLAPEPKYSNSTLSEEFDTVGQLMDAQVFDHISETQSASNQIDDTLLAARSSDALETPRRKKRKTIRTETTSEMKSGNFMKYAATALAGMAIGAIGTVVGLVALPQDYFV